MRTRRRSTIEPTAEMQAAARSAAESEGLDFSAYEPIPAKASRLDGAPLTTWTSATSTRAIVVELHPDGPVGTVTPGIGGKSASGNAREEVIKVRVTRSEKDRLEAAAARIGREVSPWLRDLGLQQAGA